MIHLCFIYDPVTKTTWCVHTATAKGVPHFDKMRDEAVASGLNVATVIGPDEQKRWMIENQKAALAHMSENPAQFSPVPEF